MAPLKQEWHLHHDTITVSVIIDQRKIIQCHDIMPAAACGYTWIYTSIDADVLSVLNRTLVLIAGRVNTDAIIVNTLISGHNQQHAHVHTAIRIIEEHQNLAYLMVKSMSNLKHWMFLTAENVFQMLRCWT